MGNFELPQHSKLLTGVRRAVRFNGIDIWGPITQREAKLYALLREQVVVEWKPETAAEISDFLKLNSHVIRMTIQPNFRVSVKYLPNLARWERYAEFHKRALEKERASIATKAPMDIRGAVLAVLKKHGVGGDTTKPKKRKPLTPERREKAKAYWKARAISAKTYDKQRLYWGRYYKVDQAALTPEQRAALRSLKAAMAAHNKHLGEVTGDFKRLHFKRDKTAADKVRYAELKALRLQRRKAFEAAKALYENTERAFKDAVARAEQPAQESAP